MNKIKINTIDDLQGLEVDSMKIMLYKPVYIFKSHPNRKFGLFIMEIEKGKDLHRMSFYYDSFNLIVESMQSFKRITGYELDFINYKFDYKEEKICFIEPKVKINGAVVQKFAMSKNHMG